MHTRLDIRTTNPRSLTEGLSAPGLAALGLAGAALVWTIYRDIALRRAIARERRERKAADVREEERRHAEITIVRRDTPRARDRREDREARLVGLNTGASSGSDSGVDFSMSVQNDGGAPAHDVTLWLTLDEPGIAPEDAQRLTEPHSFAVVMPRDPPLPFNLRQAGPFYGARLERNGLVVAAWRDGNGDHVDKIGRLTVFQ